MAETLRALQPYNSRYSSPYTNIATSNNKHMEFNQNS